MVRQSSLFSNQIEEFSLRDGHCTLIHNYLQESAASALFERLLAEVTWTQDELFLFGKKHRAPRLSCWMAESDLSYRYSNMTMQPKPWLDFIKRLADRVSDTSEQNFNSVLINHYRDGQDSNGWHADNEAELGPDPIVASLSLGAQRDFRLRHNHSRESLKLALPHGSLLIMRSGMQTHWQHTLPKRAQSKARINLTFRTIYR